MTDQAKKPTSATAKAQTSGSAFWVLVRTLAVATLFVVGFEAVARHFDLLDPTELDDVYLGFPGTSELYRKEQVADGRWIHRTSPNKLKVYREVTFRVEKPQEEFRVFCIGASTTRSDSFMVPDGSYPAMLEIYLAELMPDRKVRCINSGGGGMSSIQNLEVLREVLHYQPDLICICPEAGDKNLIPPSPEGVMAVKDDDDPLRVPVRRALSRSRLYVGARETLRRVQQDDREDAAMRSAFSAFFLYAIGRPFATDSFSRLFELKHDRVPTVMPYAIPAAEIDRAHARFRANLHEMARLCRAASVPLIFLMPLRNPKASFYLRFHIDPSEIKPGRQEEWQDLYTRGLAAKQAGRHEEALRLLKQVRELYVDDRDEILAFYLGECLEQLGRTAEARAEYELPYQRNPSTTILKQTVEELGVPTANPYPLVVRNTKDGIPGYDEFTDSVHPMPDTNRAIALSIIELIRAREMLPLAGRDRQRVAEAAVKTRVSKFSAPEHNRMVKAMVEGRVDDAIKIGRSLPENVLIEERLLEPLYLGWALTMKGDIDGSRDLYRKLRRFRLKGMEDQALPALDSDADVIRVAFAGDVFAWF